MTQVILYAGTTSWTVPANCTATIECFGSGGNGLTGGVGSYYSANGGGGGGYANATSVSLTGGTTINVQIGAAGSQTDTWFNSSSYLLASAGNGSTHGSGSGTAATLTYTGQNGGYGAQSGTSAPSGNGGNCGGPSGSPYAGAGAVGAGAYSNGYNGSNYGGGGSGGCANGYTGGNGAAGLIVINYTPTGGGSYNTTQMFAMFPQGLF